MLVHGDWPTYGAELIDEKADAEMNWVISLIEEIRSSRTQMRVPVGLKLPMVQVALDDKGRASWARNEAIICRLARIDSLTEAAAPKAPSPSPSRAAPSRYRWKASSIYPKKSRAFPRVGEASKRHRRAFRDNRLNNPKFIASAAEEIIDETRETCALTKPKPPN